MNVKLTKEQVSALREYLNWDKPYDHDGTMAIEINSGVSDEMLIDGLQLAEISAYQEDVRNGHAE